MTPHSLLIVEDENIVAMNLRQKLEGLGFRVVGTARTGEAASRVKSAVVARPLRRQSEATWGEGRTFMW